MSIFNNKLLNLTDGDSQFIVYIIIGIAILGVIAASIICFTITGRGRRIKKLYQVLKQNYDKLHNDILNRDAHYLKRLESMRDTNLIYVDLSDSLSETYKHILTEYDSKVNDMINELGELVRRKEWSEFKKSYTQYSITIQKYNNLVTDLDNNLTDQFTIEEDLNAKVKVFEDSLTKQQMLFESIESRIDMCSDAFKKIIIGIKDELNTVRREIESAYYDDAGKLLVTIEKMLKELEEALAIYPSLCDEVKITLPNKINLLQEKFDTLSSKQIPLQHLHVNINLKDFNDELADIYHKMNSLEYRHVQKRVDAISEQIDELLVSCDKELECAGVVDVGCEPVYEECEKIEKRFINLRQKLYKVQEFYLLNDEYSNFIDKIQLRVDQMSSIKRQLDTFVHSSTKQPYSILNDKMNELRGECSEVNVMIDQFDSYMTSLQVQADESFNLINISYMNLKIMEKGLRDLNIESMNVRYGETIDFLYQQLDCIYNILMSNPINVDNAIKYANQVREVSKNMFDDYNERIKLAKKAEENILLANKSRSEFQDFALILNEADKHFLAGDFESSNREVTTILEKMNIQ
ncbi:MAG: hypothetical protein HUJ61_04445 [Bacilli bacterium]|nr:hypothetical protein [Bacilli bacterium]